MFRKKPVDLISSSSSDRDADALTQLFQQLLFKVTVYTDSTHDLGCESFKQILQEFAQLDEHEEAQCAVICLMSHGEEGYLTTKEGDKVTTKTNNSGGIQGGISNGEDIYFRVLFKPVATISIKQNTLDKDLNAVELEAKGRHDPCVLPRAVPIVEAMAALTLVDLYLMTGPLTP